VIATGLFFGPVVFGHQIFVERDLLRVYYPLHKFWADQVRAGHFPVWYPYDGLGQPFVGMVISGAFHPFNLLYLALPLGTAMSVSVLVCYPLAFTGTFLFCRRWGMGLAPSLFAGMLYAFNGYLIGITNNPGYLVSAATFPLAFWAADRFFSSPGLLACATAALLMALVLFGGDSQSFAVTSTLVIPVGLCSRTRRPVSQAVGLLLGIFTLTALFTLPQLVSALHVVQAGSPGARSLSDATVWSLPPLRLYDLVVGPAWAPHFHSGPDYQKLSNALTGGPFSWLWVDSIHMGALPVALSLIGCHAARQRGRTWVLVVASLSFLWLALGSLGGLYGLAFQWVPLWRPFRYPIKLMPYVLFGVALGAGWGLQACLVRPRYRRMAGMLLAGVSIILLSIASLPDLPALVVRLGLSGRPSPTAGLASLAEAVRITCLHTGVVSLVAVLALLASLRPLLRASLLWLTAFSALLVANRPVYSTAKPDLLTTAPGLLNRILADPEVGLGRGRVASAAGSGAGEMPNSSDLTGAELDATSNLIAMRADTPALRGLESLEAYLPAVSQAFSDMEAHHSRWLGAHTDIYSAHYVVVPPGGRIGARQEPLLYSSSFGVSLLKNLTPKPRAYLARAHCLASHEEVIAALIGSNFDPNGEALMQCPQTDERPSTEASPSTELGTVRVTRYSPSRVKVEADAREDAVLILNDAYYPGWRATVDGEPALILRANGLVRAVRVPSGRHRVTFTFAPPFFWTACLISLLTLALSFGLGVARDRGLLRWTRSDTQVTKFGRGPDLLGP